MEDEVDVEWGFLEWVCWGVDCHVRMRGSVQGATIVILDLSFGVVVAI